MSDAQPRGVSGEVRPGNVRPGGRSRRVRRAVLDATGRVLLAKGYEGLSVADVAREADVHPSTIYRRWGNKGVLVLDAVVEISTESAPAPDTGSIEGDIAQIVHLIAESLRNENFRELARSLIGLSGVDADLARDAFWRTRFDIVQQIVDNAVARGELTDPPSGWEVIETATAPLWMRALITNAPIDDALVGRLIDRAVAVARGVNLPAN